MLPLLPKEVPMKKSILGCIAILLVVGFGQASAQQRAGDVELQFYGMYFQIVGTDESFGSGTIGGKIGPYLSDHLQIGIGPSLTITTMTETNYTYNPITYQVVTTKETKTTTTFGTSVFLIYSFLARGGKVVPYFGAQWFKSDFNKPLSEDRGSAGLTAGMKYFFARKTALDFSANYGWDLNPVDEGGFGGGVLMFAFGLSFLF
jgi:hypothetical protein